MKSALYAGFVTHRRFRPRAHALRYRLFQGLFDLDELDGIDSILRFFSHNRFNLLSFHDRDYGDGSARPLREQIEGHLRAAGIAPAGGAIRLLTMPRMLGHVFNPISVWFCHRPDGTLQAMLYEVTNTFKERHTYLIPVEGVGEGGVIRQRCEKRLYVSPFMDMGMAYDFTIRPPGEAVGISVAGGDAEGPLIVATFAGRRRGFGDGAILRVLAGFPLMTIKVVAGIHYEALRLWLKGVRVRRHGPPPDKAVTIGPGGLGQEASTGSA